MRSIVIFVAVSVLTFESISAFPQLPCVHNTGQQQRSPCSPLRMKQRSSSTQQAHRSQARNNRLLHLLSIPRQNRTQAETKEIGGLFSRGETFNAEDFTPAHLNFKREQNSMFVALSEYCCPPPLPSPKVFYLDGPDGGSTAALRSAGFDSQQLFVANLFPETCSTLLLAPHKLRKSNIFCGRAEEALSDSFQNIPFAALYLDGCSGSPASIIAMIEAIFHDQRKEVNPACMSIGFTLSEADPSGRNLFDREQDVTRAVTAAAAAHGFRMERVGDDPLRFGVSESSSKKHGAVLTTWLYLSRRAQP